MNTELLPQLISALTVISAITIIISLIFGKEKSHDTNDWIYKRNIITIGTIFGIRTDHIFIRYGYIPLYSENIPYDNKARTMSTLICCVCRDASKCKDCTVLMKKRKLKKYCILSNKKDECDECKKCEK